MSGQLETSTDGGDDDLDGAADDKRITRGRWEYDRRTTGGGWEDEG